MSMNIINLMNIENLEWLMNTGYITKRKHPKLDLWILNYTNSCQFENLWNNETENCRGLIIDTNGNIVLRPWKKFKNYEQVLDIIPNESFELTTKMDGSLFIVGKYKGELIYSTRGSFESEQAFWGGKLLQSKYKDFDFKEGLTYLFEVIFNENKIVCKYDFEDIVLLSIIKTETGKELPLNEDYPFPVVKKYDWNSELKELQKLNLNNEEGFVATFQNGFKCKIKFENYCRLHKIINGVNERRIHEVLANGQSLKEILDIVPDEFYKWIKSVEHDLMISYNATEGVSKLMYEDALKYADGMGNFMVNPEDSKKLHRKNFAKFVSKCDSAVIKSVCFQMYGGMDYKNIIWKSLTPRGDQKFRTIEEE